MSWPVVGRRFLPHSRPPGCSGSELPAVVPIEAEVEEPAEVDRGGSDRQSESVGVDSSVSAAAVAVGDEPGDRSFDHRPMLLVVVDEIGVGGLAGAVRGEELIVFADDKGLAIDS